MEPRSLSKKLEEYLDSLNDGRSNHSVGDIAEINMGWETELFTLHHSYTENDAPVTENLVLRIFSGDGAASKAFKEYHLMRRLQEVGYPVPPVYNLEDSGRFIDKPFITMKRIMGKTLDATYSNESAQVIREGLRRLMELFVRLHGLDPSKFSDVPSLPSTDSTKAHLSYFVETRNQVAPWITPVIDWLTDNAPGEAPGYRALCHMDYHGMNVMLDQDDRPYVIDWGASRIGDSRLDVAWTILLYTTFGGPKLRRPLIETYESLGGRLEDLEFFEVVAAARRITDLIRMTADSGSIGLKPDGLEMMRKSREHFGRVHDFLEERTGIRLAELVELLKTF